MTEVYSRRLRLPTFPITSILFCIFLVVVVTDFVLCYFHLERGNTPRPDRLCNRLCKYYRKVLCRVLQLFCFIASSIVFVIVVVSFSSVHSLSLTFKYISCTYKWFDKVKAKCVLHDISQRVDTKSEFVSENRTTQNTHL